MNNVSIMVDFPLPGEQDGSHWTLGYFCVQLMLQAIFTVDVAVRMVVLGRPFWKALDGYWNGGLTWEFTERIDRRTDLGFAVYNFNLFLYMRLVYVCVCALVQDLQIFWAMLLVRKRSMSLKYAEWLYNLDMNLHEPAVSINLAGNDCWPC